MEAGEMEEGMVGGVEEMEQQHNKSQVAGAAAAAFSERERKLAFTEWSMRNLQISFIHSVLSSLWLIRIVIVRFEPLFADLIFYVSWDTYLLVAFSAGYFLYDFYDIYANGYVRREWVVCVHHVIVLISFSYHLCALQSIGYTCLALAMEFNSVFLHARKLLSFYMFGKRSLPYLVNCACNVLTFSAFRFGVLGVIYYGTLHIHASLLLDGPIHSLTAVYYHFFQHKIYTLTVHIALIVHNNKSGTLFIRSSIRFRQLNLDLNASKNNFLRIL